MKPRITLLANLEEGDKFYFAEENGKLKNTTPYYVEGQYPKFHCTTVCAEHNIKPCSSGNGQHMTMVTGVEDVQWVQIIQANNEKNPIHNNSHHPSRQLLCRKKNGTNPLQPPGTCRGHNHVYRYNHYYPTTRGQKNIYNRRPTGIESR